MLVVSHSSLWARDAGARGHFFLPDILIFYPDSRYFVKRSQNFAFLSSALAAFSCYVQECGKTLVLA